MEPDGDGDRRRSQSAGAAVSFALYRIIGNDLPPRHVPGQHLRNLTFVLDHEPLLERCQRWWVLNRLTDAQEEAELAALLEERGCRYLRLPFSLDEYARRGWRLDFGRPLYDAEFHALPERTRLLLLEHTYHDKNRYVMNNNGARNAALEHGRARADWVLPWDGNCFVTASAWRELVAAAEAAADMDYLVVPMARAGDDEIRHRDDDWRPEATDEPQVAFSAGAPQGFDERLRYGRNPKAALLRGLGVPGIWNERSHEPWEPGLPESGSVDARWREAGWVVRLTSGRPDLEQRPGRRVRQRREAIARKLDDLDERVARRHFSCDAPFAWDSVRMTAQRDAWRAGEPALARVVAALCAQAQRPRPTGAPATDVILGGLAWSFTGSEALARGAVEQLTRLLEQVPVDLVPRTVMLDPTGDATELIHVAEAVRLLATSDSLDAQLLAATRAWFTELLTALIAARPNEQVAQRADCHGLWFEALTLAAAAFVDDVRTLTTTHRRVCSRLHTQIGPDGQPLGDLEAACSQDASASAVLAWLTLARMASRFGEDLLGERGRHGQSLPGLLGWFLRASAGPWPGRQRLPHDLDISEAVTLRAAWQCPELVAPRTITDRGAAYRIKQHVPSGTGLRPFWVLGE